MLVLSSCKTGIIPSTTYICIYTPLKTNYKTFTAVEQPMTFSILILHANGTNGLQTAFYLKLTPFSFMLFALGS